VGKFPTMNSEWVGMASPQAATKPPAPKPARPNWPAVHATFDAIEQAALAVIKEVRIPSPAAASPPSPPAVAKLVSAGGARGPTAAAARTETPG
jgi:hypothetical protein